MKQNGRTEKERSGSDKYPGGETAPRFVTTVSLRTKQYCHRAAQRRSTASTRLTPRGCHCSVHESSRPVSSLSKQRVERNWPCPPRFAQRYKVDREYRGARVFLPFLFAGIVRISLSKKQTQWPSPSAHLGPTFCSIVLKGLRSSRERTRRGRGWWRALTLFESRVFDLGPVGVHQPGFMPTENSRPLPSPGKHSDFGLPFSDLVGSPRERPTPPSLSLSRSHALPSRTWKQISRPPCLIADRSYHSARCAILVACRPNTAIQSPPPLLLLRHKRNPRRSSSKLSFQRVEM